VSGLPEPSANQSAATEKCGGLSSTGATRGRAGRCPARARYRVDIGARAVYACGRHVAWVLATLYEPGDTATVTRLDSPA
jgi:hypothetical protein